MSSKKKLIADLLFGIQIIGALVLCGSQFIRFLKETQGQLLSMFLLVEAFLILNFWLAKKAHRVQASYVTGQTLVIYKIWLVLIGSNILAFFLNGNYQWSRNDTMTIIIALCMTAVVFVGAKIRKIDLKDPMLKSFLAMLFKAFPQAMMAIKISQVGGGGLPVWAVVAGHITISVRILQISITIREAGWDRNRIWLCVNEVVNELSWIAVSIVWIIWLSSS